MDQPITDDQRRQSARRRSAIPAELSAERIDAFYPAPAEEEVRP